MSRKPRGLSPEETALWQSAVERTKPLFPKTQRPRIIPELAPKTKISSALRFPDFHVGQAVTSAALRHDLAPALKERLSGLPIRMDTKAYGKMTRGKLRPEGRIDLHGMTLAQAQPVLTTFILSAYAAQKRLVLVITGKGKAGADDGPIPVRRGILKHYVPQWLGSAPLAGAVLQVSEAHLKHGGAGAYYVYLRRQR